MIARLDPLFCLFLRNRLIKTKQRGVSPAVEIAPERETPHAAELLRLWPACGQTGGAQRVSRFLCYQSMA